MNLFVFTDTHDQEHFMRIIEERIVQADIILCGGDITIFGDRLEAILFRLHSWKKPVYIIHGNHEEPYFAMKRLCAKFPYVTFLHDKIIIEEEVVLIGWGGGGFRKRTTLLEERITRWKKEVERHKRKGKKIIFMSHAPAYGTTLDLMFDHVGDMSVRETILALQPDLAISGHIHDNNGAEDTLGRTKIVNPGPMGRFFSF